MYHALVFFCLICGQKFVNQLNEILHKEFDEVLIHHEQVTECPTCSQPCASTEYQQDEEVPFADDPDQAADEGDL